MMRALIIDDELSNLENLQTLLNNHCPQVQVVGSAQNITSAISKIDLYQPDVLFLDIQLSEDSAFDLLTQVNSKSFEVIFVTAFDQFGIQAIKFAALDYILKPVDIDELIDAVAKAEVKINSTKSNQQLSVLLSYIKNDQSANAKIALPSLKEIRYVQVSAIVRCEADNTYTNFFMTDGEKLFISKSIKEYSAILKPHGFLRTHQSHLVNPIYIKSWLKEDGGVLLLTTGDKIPVSKLNRDAVKNALKGFSS